MDSISRASTSKFRRITSAVSTTLLQSPGCNEGKARNGTLGKHGQKRIELRRSGTHSERLICVVAVRELAFVEKVPPLKGLNKCVETINPGLAPWAMQESRPKGLFYAFTTKQLLGRPFRSVKTVLCFSYITSVSTSYSSQ